MELFRHNLPDHQHDEEPEEKSGSSPVSPVERHRDRITAGFSQRRSSNLDNPKPKRDLWNLAEACVLSIHNVH